MYPNYEKKFEIIQEIVVKPEKVLPKLEDFFKEISTPSIIE